MNTSNRIYPSRPLSHYNKNISHEILNLVSWIICSIPQFSSVSSIFDPFFVKSRASSSPCILKSTSGGLTKHSTHLYVQYHSLLICPSDLFVSWRCRTAFYASPDIILIMFKHFCPCVHCSWLHFTSATCTFRCKLRDCVLCLFIESYSWITASSWVFVRHNLNICSNETLTVVSSIGSKSITQNTACFKLIREAIIQKKKWYTVVNTTSFLDEKVYCKDLRSFKAIGHKSG